MWEWQGTFLQLAAHQDDAKKAYERCEATLARDGKPCPTDVLIKLAWVHMDKEDPKTVIEFERLAQRWRGVLCVAQNCCGAISCNEYRLRQIAMPKSVSRTV